MDDVLRTLDDHRGAQPADVAGDPASSASSGGAAGEVPPVDPTPPIPDTIPTWYLNDTLVTTPKHAARLIGVHWRTIYHWIQQGWVMVRYTPSGQVRVVVEDLLREDGEARQGRPRKVVTEGES